MGSHTYRGEIVHVWQTERMIKQLNGIIKIVVMNKNYLKLFRVVLFSLYHFLLYFIIISKVKTKLKIYNENEVVNNGIALPTNY